MTFRGHVQNGAIVLDETARLPEGATVLIEIQHLPKSHRDPRGILKSNGVETSDADIAEIRHDMWRGIPRDDLT